jgi:hypothetical protein
MSKQKIRVIDDLLLKFFKQEEYTSFKSLPKSLVNKTKKWLGKKGLKLFRKIKEKHGTVNACWDEGGIPHPVHFREGMQVRNFMRGCEECKDWGTMTLITIGYI